MLRFRNVALAVTALAVVTLSGCSAEPDGFGFSKKGETVYSEGVINSITTGSTLEGATLQDETSGWTIRELESGEAPKELKEAGEGAIRLLDGKLYLEAGGGENAECRSNFEEISFAAESSTLFLVHQRGDRPKEPCAEDEYRAAYFEVIAEPETALSALEKVTVFEQSYEVSEDDPELIGVNAEPTATYIKDDWR